MTVHKKIRFLANQHYLIKNNKLDIGNIIDEWFHKQEKIVCNEFTINEVAQIISDNLTKKEYQNFIDIGRLDSPISVLVLEDLCSIDNPILIEIIHEALSTKLCGLIDINYPYEDHKLVYPKDVGETYKNWGNGSGSISAHTDNPYEVIDADLLSLTVCRDITERSTNLYMIKDLIDQLSDEDLETLYATEATFISGKNVRGRIVQRTRPVIELTDKSVHFNFDFRIDKHVGKRMIATTPCGEKVLNKLATILADLKPYNHKNKTGIFLILSNRIVLHARGSIDKCEAHEDPCKAERLLFRSAGQKKVYKNLALNNIEESQKSCNNFEHRKAG